MTAEPPLSTVKPHEYLVPAVHALLFAAGEPVSAGVIGVALGDLDPALITAALLALQTQLEQDAALVLDKVAGGWQLRTHPRYAKAVLRLRGGRAKRLSQAALEVLSVVAYQQPATRADVEQVRGVASGGVLKSLIDKGLVRTTGRRDLPGRPLEYGTTPLFLELFSLSDLLALPTLRERESLVEDHEGP
ncbi:MAG: segregation and condensation protein B [Kiritimatiellia bacterium]|jgi:segregation and condensation protein B